MRFYEVVVEAENGEGEWQGSGYWFVKPDPSHFTPFLGKVMIALARGVKDHDFSRENGLVIMVSVIDVPLEQVARYQRDAYQHDQEDDVPALQWVMTSARWGLNGGTTNGQG